MTDGRTYHPAHLAERTPLLHRLPLALGTRSRHLRRVAVPAVATLALTGVGVLGVAPAHAEDLGSRIDRVQADVDRLDAAAQAATTQQERAQQRVGDSRQRVERLDRRIQQQQQLADALRLQLAHSVLTETAASGGTAVPVAAEPMPDASEQLLASVAVVTEDTDGTSTELSQAEQAVTDLTRTQAQVRERLQERRTVVQAASAQAAQAQDRFDQRQERLDTLEAQQAEELASRSAVDYAMAQVGKSYVWGASGPSSFDCSGLTMAAWATEGVSLPHSSSAQYSSGTRVSESELQPGDLVFYYSPISHVGIYVGDGQIVNALNPGSGVQISGLHDMPYSGAVRPG